MAHLNREMGHQRSGKLPDEGERIEVADWLRAHGGVITAAPSADQLMAATTAPYRVASMPWPMTMQSKRSCPPR